MRFAGRFGFRIAPDTQALCRRLNLAELPRERIWEEIKKLLLQSPQPSQGFGYAQKLGVLKFFPELQALHDASASEGAQSPWELTLAFLDQAAIAVRRDPPQGAVLMTAVLCFGLTQLDAAAPDGADPDGADPDGAAPDGAAEAAGLFTAGEPALVARFLGRLTNETRFIEGVMGLTAELVKVQVLFKTRDRAGDGEVRRLALRIEIPFLLKAASALHRARQGEAAFPAGNWLEARARALGVWEGPPEPLLKGRHLLKHGMKTGRGMGNLLDAVFQLQLDGAIASQEAALAWVVAHANEAQWVQGVPPGGAPTSGAPTSGGGERSGGGNLAGWGDKQ
jgi:tRNA nucleotidyltransferase (CCA-adding enzyme)